MLLRIVIDVVIFRHKHMYLDRQPGSPVLNGCSFLTYFYSEHFLCEFKCLKYFLITCILGLRRILLTAAYSVKTLSSMFSSDQCSLCVSTDMIYFSLKYLQHAK